jgi:hypothetical protein
MMMKMMNQGVDDDDDDDYDDIQVVNYNTVI